VTQINHIFFNDRGFHNHIVHHLLTLYALGAPASVIEKHYRRNAAYQRPQFPVEERNVTDMGNPEHFTKYMGREKYYHDYVIFFQREMELKGWESVLNEYLFSGTEQADDLLARTFAGELLPLQIEQLQDIHTHRTLAPSNPPWIWDRIPPTSHYC
jgi:hypothetical protein